MQEILLKLIEQLNGAVVVLLLILMACFWCIYKLGFWSHKFFEHDKKVDKLEGMSEKVVALTTKVDLIYTILMDVHRHTPDQQKK